MFVMDATGCCSILLDAACSLCNHSGPVRLDEHLDEHQKRWLLQFFQVVVLRDDRVKHVDMEETIEPQEYPGEYGPSLVDEGKETKNLVSEDS